LIFDAAVIIPTTLSPELRRAVRSIFAQDFTGKVQILIGVDVPKGDPATIEQLRRECPLHMQLTVLDIGYSTSRRHGGIYRNWSGGALRTMLSYAANARYIAYLDDDNWWAPSHLSDLLRKIPAHDWAYSYRWYVHPGTQQPLCVDEWESTGPDCGIYRDKYNGFVDTNCLMIDKLKCHWVLPAWCIPKDRKGAGEDRVVFEHLNRKHKGVCTGKATAYYVVRETDVKIIERFMQRKKKGPEARYSAGPNR
jgi:glycosyltransferase involved in cell wall biosynthesis